MKNKLTYKAPTGLEFSHTGIRLDTMEFISIYLTKTRNINIEMHPELYHENPPPITSKELLNDLLNCSTGEQLYELIEDWTGPDPISTMIMELIGAGQNGFKNS